MLAVLQLLALLALGCLGAAEQGCKRWKAVGEDVCCLECYAGHRLVNRCGKNPQDLCKPCQDGRWSEDSDKSQCQRCTHCAGAQVLQKQCTPRSDTVCTCKPGLRCGDPRCSFCVDECGRGQEPTDTRSCAPCPSGTFNAGGHQKCQPWSTRCPESNQRVVFKGNTTSDIQCGPEPPRDEPQALMMFTVIGALLLLLCVCIVTVGLTVHRKGKKSKKTTKKTQIIRAPTDDPRTLIAIECSFHEAQQEQGISTESLISGDI